MNEPIKILIAGACGAVASLGIQAAAHVINPKPVVHYYAPEPEQPEELAKVQAEKAALKAARKAATQAFVEKCLEQNPKQGNTVFVTDTGVVACGLRGRPPDEWLDK